MKPSIMAGVAVGLATGAWMFAEYALGLHEGASGGVGQWTGFLSLALPVIGAWWVVRTAALPAWSAAAREGMIFGGTSGLINGVAIFLYFTVINPDFAAGSGPELAGMQALLGFVSAIVLGGVVVILLHALFRRRRKDNA